MAGQPKTKTHELGEQVNALLASRERDPFTVSRLKKEANSLVGKDPLEARLILGIISALEEDIAGVRQYFQGALELNRNHFSANLGFFSSLDYLGFFSEAFPFGEKACELRPDDPEPLRIFLDGLRRSGRLHQANQVIEKLLKLKQEIPEEVVLTVRESGRFLDENQVKDEDVEKLVDLSVSVLREREIRFEGMASEVMEDEDSEFLSFKFEVERPVKEIVELDYQAAKKLALREDLDDVGDFVIVSFTSAIPG